jgi:Ca2+-transporting ATPase
MIMCLGTLWLFSRTLSADGALKAQTMVFTSVIMFEMFQVFSCRSLTRPSFQVGIFKNKYLLVAVLISLLLHIGILYIPVLQQLFRVSPLSWEDWVILSLISSTGFIYLETHKFLFGKAGRIMNPEPKQ